MKSKGFTLIELLVVSSVVVLISTVILANFNNQRIKNRDGKRKADLGQIQLALEQYYDQNGFYPTCFGGSAICSTCNYPNANTTLESLAMVPGIISNIEKDPINTGGRYCYYYARGYSKTGPYAATRTNLDTDYVVTSTLEIGGQCSVPNCVRFYIPGSVCFGAGGDTCYLNYLLGN